MLDYFKLIFAAEISNDRYAVQSLDRLSVRPVGFTGADTGKIYVISLDFVVSVLSVPESRYLHL